MINPNTIAAAESPEQLRSTGIRVYKIFVKASKRFMSKKIYDRGNFLKAVFTGIRFGESAYQKSKAKFIRMISNEICQSIAQQFQQKKTPEEKQQELEKIKRLKDLLLVLDQEQAIERRKADMMTRWIRGTYSEVTKIEKSLTGDFEAYKQWRQKMISRMQQEKQRGQAR
ncbi:hypothetical protein HYU09_04330 [Candidatus Woesearchaeota archaeon]|nr:hypothetical protein [Candidatus Woesearchaeota archaeon]